MKNVMGTAVVHTDCVPERFGLKRSGSGGATIQSNLGGKSRK